jgi:hypothetical protein
MYKGVPISQIITTDKLYIDRVLLQVFQFRNFGANGLVTLSRLGSGRFSPTM